MPIAERQAQDETVENGVGAHGIGGHVSFRSNIDNLLEKKSREELATVVRRYLPDALEPFPRHRWHREGPREPKLISAHWGLVDETELKFRQSLQEWKEGTKFSSSTTDLITDPAYLRIIGLGPPVLPYLLAELRENPDHWFWALEAISGTDPAGANDEFDIRVEKWLTWGLKLGYIGARV
jgi:hypothetical protein